jgi:cell division protein ZapA
MLLIQEGFCKSMKKSTSPGGEAVPEKINRVEVKINDVIYVLKGTEPPEYMEMLASQLDRRLSQMQEMNPRLSMHQAAILTSLNILDEYMKLREEHRSLEELLEEESKEKAKK